VKVARPSLSIRTRLALLYTGLLVAAMIVFGTGVYLVLRNELERSFDTSLIANAEHAAGAFAQDINADGLLRPSARLVEQLASTGGRVLVLDPAGNVLADSAPAGTPTLPLSAADLTVASGAVREFTAPGGDTRRLTVKTVLAAGKAAGYVVWADTTKPLRDVLTTVSAAFLLGGLAVTGLALAGGLVLARRALTPVAEVTQTARSIALSGDFAARVDVGHAGDEVGDLAIAFNEMLQALELNHQTLQRFLGDASHQLRTPLTTIRANLDLAVRPELDPGERAAILADAKGEAERMGRLVADLLSLARADSGERLRLEPVELDAVLVEAVRQLRGAHPSVRMSVTSVEPAIVDGDRDRLRELVGILLENAGRYTPAGGSVTASLEVRSGRVIIRVVDTGVGFDSQDQERLFDRLYRGARARSMRPAGTGLGLAIARWIVERHGGSIDLVSPASGGTIATVSLPAKAT
jgi:Signal transduction histidine kinase